MKGPGRVHCPVLCPNNDTPRPALTSRCYPLCNGRQPLFHSLSQTKIHPDSSPIRAVFQCFPIIPLGIVSIY